MEPQVEFPEAVVKPVFVDGKKVSRWVAIVNARDGYVYNIATKHYTLVQHEYVYRTVEEVLKDYGIDPEVDVTFTRRGARMYARFYIDEFEPDDGDIVKLGIIARNSYDGTMSVSISGGGFRVACSNGLVFPLWMYGKYTAHVGSVENRVRSMIEHLVDNMTQLKDILRAAVENKISTIDAIDFIEALPIAKSRKEEIIKLLPKDETIRVWDVYNAMTYHFTHSVGKMSLDTAYTLNALAAKILVKHKE